VESRALTDASGVGDGPTGAREGRCKLCLVVITNTMAEGIEPARSTAVLGEYEAAAHERIQGEEETIRSRHLEEILVG